MEKQSVKRLVKKMALWALVILLLVAVFYRDELRYGWMQASGQLHVLRNVVEVEEIMADPAFPDSLKQRIRLIQEIKQFGVDSLGLNPSDNYTTFYDQKGKPILWVITASPPYRLEAREWKFPVIGAFPYKGYFDREKSEEEVEELEKLGLDTHVSEVSAWSTLGYLRDPILSSMLGRSEGRLANLILHELTHGTLFVKGDLELNENLASFVGDWGAVRFLNHKYGPESKELRKYEYAKKYTDAYAQHVLRGANQLDSLYATFADQAPDVRKDTLKESLIRRIVETADTLLGGQVALRTETDSTETKLPNNAYFIGYKTYKSRQNEFLEEFRTKFGSDFKKYMHYLKGKYPSL